MNKGNNAQWIAHATAADTPNALQLICSFISGKDIYVQLCCKIYLPLAFQNQSSNRSTFDCMSKKIIFYIVFFVALVIVFYLTMSFLLPGFGKSKLAPIGKVQPFAFQNQDGKTVTQKDVAGKVLVVEYFFTTCKTWCPIMNTNMMMVYDRFKDRGDFLILSHTSDPETDSPARLKKYADSLKVNTEKWIFLTGTKDSLYKQARYSYHIDDPNNYPLGNSVDFIHSQFFALVDKKGIVRNIYEGNQKGDVERMMTEIEKLLK